MHTEPVALVELQSVTGEGDYLHCIEDSAKVKGRVE